MVRIASADLQVQKIHVLTHCLGPQTPHKKSKKYFGVEKNIVYLPWLGIL